MRVVIIFIKLQFIGIFSTKVTIMIIIINSFKFHFSNIILSHSSTAHLEYKKHTSLVTGNVQSAVFT